MTERRCPHCNRVIVGHPNKKFCNSKCKDRYHNEHNPRGIFAHLEPRRFTAQEREQHEADEAGWAAVEAGWNGHENVTGRIKDD